MASQGSVEQLTRYSNYPTPCGAFLPPRNLPRASFRPSPSPHPCLRVTVKGGWRRTPFCPNLSCSHACCTSDGNPPSRIRITADTFASGSFAGRIAPDAAPSATWRTSTYHGSFLSTNKISQASPGAPELTDRTEFLNGHGSPHRTASVFSVPLCLTPPRRTAPCRPDPEAERRRSGNSAGTRRWQ